MAYEQIRVERRGEVELLTMNRPDKLNAWTPKMSEELADAIQKANADEDVGAIVLTGEGRGFCAGADMDATFKTRLDGGDPGADTAGGSGGLPAGLDWISLIRDSKPCIAAVNGAAVGIGVTQILPFDVIVASEKAKFGFVFVKVGIVPELASTHFLTQRVGWGRANELMLTARLVPGAEAVELRLADILTPPDEVVDTAVRLGAQIAQNPAPMLRMTKDLLMRNAVETDLTTVQRRETDYLKQCWSLPEHHEAVNAFLEKRAPDFKAARRKAAAAS
ncbi:MAG: enoyl-CoA hydratase-related protein [Pseudomonadota bacterium]